MREMVTGEIPQPYQMREQLALLVPGIDCQSDVASLIQECCHNDPQQRPSAEHVHDRLTAWCVHAPLSIPPVNGALVRLLAVCLLREMQIRWMSRCCLQILVLE